MSRIVILGCGIEGKHMAIDLCKTPGLEVTAVDIDAEALDDLAREHPIQTRQADLSTPDGITGAVEDADVIIGALPGFMGYSALAGVIRAGRDIVDISYFEEDPFGLDKLAKEKGVTAVVDCGVAPGMSNIILGDHSRSMNVARYECYVGGLPKSRDVLFEYKSAFPAVEVLEEYAGSSRSRENGKAIVRSMLDGNATMEFDGIGPLACLHTDGLRTLFRTMEIPDMMEKTLRYPGHADQMRMLRDAGFLGRDPVDVNGVSIRPIDVISALIAPHWRFESGEADLTIMRLFITGDENGKTVTYTYDLHDEYDPVTGTLSMARTTGYTCTAVALLVLDGGYSREGICPPEFVGMAKGCRDRIEKYLADRGVHYRMQRS